MASEIRKPTLAGMCVGFSARNAASDQGWEDNQMPETAGAVA